MDAKRTSKLSYLRQRRILLFGLLSIAGLSFWFFLGFPFANHNESYRWVGPLGQLGPLDVLGKPPGLAANFRPLGMWTAWLGYRLSGGSIYPQQIFNWLVAVLAWLLLFSAIKEKRLFGWVSLLVGGGFFSGYIYLFHLHGVFYGPLLLFLAFLLATGISDRDARASRLITVSIVAALVSLYHPFALLLYVAFVLGYLLENLRRVTRKQLAIGGLFLVASFGLVKILVPDRGLPLTTNAMAGFLTSYRMVEVNRAVSVVSWLLSVLTVVSLNTSWRKRAVLGVVTTVLSFAFVWLNWPVLMVWIALCVFKSILMRKWTVVFLVAAAALLPLASATGSPTYTIFVLMACSCVVPLGYPVLERESLLRDSVALVALILIVCAFGFLKAGAHLPVVSRLANPLLAEKEKTFQMEDVARWVMSSEFKERRLVLYEAWGGPTASANAVERRHRPPTGQDYLDAYMDGLRGSQAHRGIGQLWISFGNEKIAGAERLYAVPGKYNGEAAVWEVRQAER